MPPEPKISAMLTDSCGFQHHGDPKLAQDRALDHRGLLTSWGAGEYFPQIYLTPLSARSGQHLWTRSWIFPA